MEENNVDLEKKENEEKQVETTFKAPILVEKVGKLPKKVSSDTERVQITGRLFLSVQELTNASTNVMPYQRQNQKPEQYSVTIPLPQIGSSTLIPYKEPPWSGLPMSQGKDYILEVLKQGSIVEYIDLMSKSFWVFGRIPSCDICMLHPTVSRYHAVIQYRNEPSETEGPGFYVYDLGSTHGTFLNKNKLKPKVYARFHVGHMLKLGCSSRSYIMTGPEYDKEAESEFTISELRQQREEELKKRKEEQLKAENELEEKQKKEEEKGVDWGLGDDAEEETDLSENPFAQSNNEELYLDDPKKALRGFFEREGLNLEYDCSEQGMGQFLCKVELPVDDDKGQSVVAEVLHKGKKKEAVVQCALEACRILDRYGVLRQATHESRKRKTKNWEENDYYDSDDDTYLDRTGTIEKKREKRMNAKLPQKTETYESLLEKEKHLSNSITEIEKKLSDVDDHNTANSQNQEEDSLDTYMNELKQSKLDKQEIAKLKIELTKLKLEYANILKLANLAKPASLPPLVANNDIPGTSKDKKNTLLPLYGKRRKMKVQLPMKLEDATNNTDGIEEEETPIIQVSLKHMNTSHKQEGDELSDNVTLPTDITKEEQSTSSEVHDASVPENYNSSSDEDGSKNDDSAKKRKHGPMTLQKFETILKKHLPPFAEHHQEQLEKILNNLKELAVNEDRMHVDWKILAAKKRKVLKLLANMTEGNDEQLEHRVSSELTRIMTELNEMTVKKYKVIDEMKKMTQQIKSFSESSKQITEKISPNNSTTSERNDKEKSNFDNNKSIEQPSATDDARINPSQSTENESSKQEDIQDKRKKKNERRINQRQEKVDQEKQRGYEEDANKEDYSMWMPPAGQSGDGRTSLNDKYGY